MAPGVTWAHVSEGGFVLLLPTEYYITIGVSSVALTVLLTLVIRSEAAQRIFRPAGNLPRLPGQAALGLSCLSFLTLAVLVAIGWIGNPDPLENLLPLSVWTVWWIAMVSLQGLAGNHWRWSNPWLGPLAFIRKLVGRGRLRLPSWLAGWPACFGLLIVAGFVLADPAPADPRRLAAVLAALMATTLIGGTVFGLRWIVQVDPFSGLMQSFASVAPLGRYRNGSGIGLWGWRILSGPVPPLSRAVFCLLILGIGSFDGLSETFWWFSLIDVNPLEYPGRSALIGQTIGGLLIANVLLLVVFALWVWAGLLVARSSLTFPRAFRAFAPAMLPIALGYHIAHYLPNFLVDVQWFSVALSDPLGRGADLLGLGEFYVTTGFFNTLASVRIIWLTQAGAVVTGHVVSILLAHAIALRETGSTRQAMLVQLPLAAFMVAYTLFGLWLLASPRGV